VTPQTLDQHEWLLYQHPLLSREFWWAERDGQRVSLPQPTAPRLRSDNYDLLLASALAGRGLLHTPLWSAAPYLADGRLVQVMADYEIDPDSFGPHILAVYPSHRRATAKVRRLSITSPRIWVHVVCRSSRSRLLQKSL
jgi:DNA-binding transcriptional LysR family regulator